MAITQTGNNFENLVVSSSDVSMSLTMPGMTPVSINTGVQLSVSISQDVQEVHGIGQVDPIALKRATRRYTGSFSLQNGEYEQELLSALIAASGLSLASLLEVKDFTLSWSMSTPKALFTYSLLNCMLSSQDMSVDRNSIETTVSFNLTATGLTRKTLPPIV